MSTSKDHAKEEEAFDRKFLLEKGFVLYPIIVSAVAVSFDVGSFVSFGMGFFTFFSLAEHLLFALQALPVALMLCFVVLLVFPIVMRPKAPSGKRKWKDLSLPSKCMVVSVLVLFAGVYLYFFVGLVYDSYLRWPEAAPVALLMIMLIPPILSVMFSDIKHRPLFAIPLAAYVAIAASFALGVGLAQAEIFGRGIADKPTSNIALKENRPHITGKVLRVGERGLLLYDHASRLLRFERWDAILSIESALPR